MESGPKITALVDCKVNGAYRDNTGTLVSLNGNYSTGDIIRQGTPVGSLLLSAQKV